MWIETVINYNGKIIIHTFQRQRYTENDEVLQWYTKIKHIHIMWQVMALRYLEFLYNIFIVL